MTFKRYVEVLEESNLRLYPIQVPPRDRESCIELVGRTNAANETWTTEIDGIPVETTFREAAKEWSTEIARHEAVHALQEINIPEIFDGLPDLTDESHLSPEYFSRPPEIMAFAHDTAMGVDVSKNIKIYRDIGGDVYRAFLHYVREYKKKIN